MSGETDRHVWIAIGKCADGSVVFVHYSPEGVQINGTRTRDNSHNSNAIKLATKYMKTYFRKWYKGFPVCERN